MTGGSVWACVFSVVGVIVGNSFSAVFLIRLSLLVRIVVVVIVDKHVDHREQITDVSTDAARAPRGLWRGGVTRPNGSFVSRARRIRIAILPTDGGRTRRSSIRAHCRSSPRLGKGQGMYLAHPSPATWAVSRAVTPGQVCFCAAKVLALCFAV